MKTNKLFVGLLLAFGVMALASKAEAGALPRSPKEVFVSSFTTGAVFVPPAISTNATTNAAFQPGAVYQVTMSSGAASEYIIMVDSTNCTNVTVTMASSSLGTGASFIGPRLLFSSTTANTVFAFDPPLEFHNGLCVIDSAVTGQYGITYELGRGLSGN